MNEFEIKQLKDQISNLEAALELIATARQKGHGIHYVEGVAESALARLRKAQVAA